MRPQMQRGQKGAMGRGGRWERDVGCGASGMAGGRDGSIHAGGAMMVIDGGDMVADGGANGCDRRARSRAAVGARTRAMLSSRRRKKERNAERERKEEEEEQEKEILWPA